MMMRMKTMWSWQRSLIKFGYMNTLPNGYEISKLQGVNLWGYPRAAIKTREGTAAAAIVAKPQ